LDENKKKFSRFNHSRRMSYGENWPELFETKMHSFFLGLHKREVFAFQLRGKKISTSKNENVMW
jgi:hypothetical protein